MKKVLYFIALMCFSIFLCSCKSSYESLNDILDYYCNTETTNKLTTYVSKNYILEASRLDNDLDIEEVSFDEVSDKKYSYEVYLNELYLNKDKLSKKFVINKVTYNIKYNKSKNKDEVNYRYDITNENFNLKLSKSVSDTSVSYMLKIYEDGFKVFYGGKNNCNIIVKDNDSYIVYSNGALKFFDEYKGFRKTVITENSEAYEYIANL